MVENHHQPENNNTMRQRQNWKSSSCNVVVTQSDKTNNGLSGIHCAKRRKIGLLVDCFLNESSSSERIDMNRNLAKVARYEEPSS